MDALIKYRNERKKEGATSAELLGLDGRINALFSKMDRTGSGSSEDLDLELLTYRRSVLEGHDYEIKSELIKRIDRHIHKVLGSSPARIGDVKVCHATTVKREVLVSVDLNNMTVEDLARKATKMLGLHGRTLRIISGGRHLEPVRLLSDYHIKSESVVFACERLGCDGNCMANGYNMLSDALLRDSAYILKELGPDKIHELFVVMSQARLLVKQKVPHPVFREQDVKANTGIATPQVYCGIPMKPGDETVKGLIACLEFEPLAVDRWNQAIGTNKSETPTVNAAATTSNHATAEVTSTSDDSIYG
jgi:hypothetical protein